MDLELWFINSLKLGTLNSTIDSLFPSFDDRQNFIHDREFARIVLSLIEKKQLSDLDEF